MQVVREAVLKVLKRPWLLPALGVAIYLAIVSTSPLNDQHILYNAEPYPDGLFYINAAQNLAQTGSFEVSYQNVVIKPYITPLYAVILAIGYLVNPDPAFFYVVNVGLGIATILCITLILKRISSSKTYQVLGLLVYLVHAHIYWLPSLPMAENAVVFFFAASLLMLLGTKPASRSIGVSAGLISLLVFIKYTLFPVALVMALFLYVRLLKERSWRSLALITSIFLVFLGVFLAYQVSIGFNPFAIFVDQSVAEEVATRSPLFYSTSFIPNNARLYGQALLGSRSWFLWLNLPVFSAGITLVFGLSMLYGGVKHWSWRAWLLLGLFAAQFPLLLIFYVVDMRYIILSQIIFSVGIALGLEKSRQKWLGLIVVAALAVQMFSQLQLMKQIIAANWFNRTVAWQYEAVKGFNLFFESETDTQPVYVITALPPLFVDLYSSGRYTLLPLSPTQEFANKEQYVWGSNLEYQNLPVSYRQLLEMKAEVYVSDAYLTSQAEFRTEFENLKQEFDLEQVQTGCLETCNLYRLSLK